MVFIQNKEHLEATERLLSRCSCMVGTPARYLLLLFDGVAPEAEGIAEHVFVVETAVTRDLSADEIGLFERFVCTGKLYFGHDQTIVLPVKLIDCERVASVGALHQIAMVVD